MSTEIPLSTPKLDRERNKERIAKKGLAGLSPTATVDSFCVTCGDDKIIPIYPLRFAYSDLFCEKGANLSYPRSLDKFKAAKDVVGRNGFTLRKLRQGYLYIFDETNQVWSIFGYFPEQGKFGSFNKMYWVEGDADEEWAETEEKYLSCAYVPSNATNIWACFSEHRWSHHIFAKAHKEDAFRNKVMSKVNVLAPDSEAQLDRLDKIADYAEEFAENGCTYSYKEWNTLSDIVLDADKTSRLKDETWVKQAKGQPILMALHDPIGVVSEIAVSHLNRVQKKTDYLEGKMYPLTVARAVDVFQNAAKERGPLSTGKEKEIYQKWQSAVSPEYKTFLEKADKEITGYEDTLDQTLSAWQHFHNMGFANPEDTIGSLQTYLTTFNPKSELPREINDLISAAAKSIKGISASEKGQQAIRRTILAKDKWDNGFNPVSSAMRLVTELSKTGHFALSELRKASTAASDLLSDLAVPGAFEIVNLNRTDILKEVTRFYQGYVNKKLTRVEVPIEDVMREITYGPGKKPKQTKLIQRGFSVKNKRNSFHTHTHTNQVSTGTYTFDGTVNVSSKAGYNLLESLGGLKTGFVLMMSSLNIFTFAQTSEKDQMQGLAGRIASPKFGLFLTAVDMTTELVALSQKALTQELPNSYKVHGKMSRGNLTKLLKGTDLSDDFIKSLAIAKNVEVPKAGLSKLSKLTVLGRIGLIAGFGLAVMDLFKGYEAHQRGDRNAVISNVSLGLGAILISAGMIGVFSGPISVIGVAVGLALIAIGIIYSRWVDDPITRWLKNGFWGTTDDYLFWDNKDRNKEISDEVGVNGSVYDGQITAINDKNLSRKFDFKRYFQREMQEFNELIYWPQKEKLPTQIRATRTVGIWPFNRETRMLDTSSNSEVIRFRLPNFVDGLSEFDVRIIAQVSAQFKTNNRYQYDHKDVTKEFYQNLKVLDEQDGILESKITLNYINNQNKSRLDDIYWKIDRIYCKPGWTYRPNSQLTLPVGYYENWTDSGYEFDEEGGQKILTLWGI